jgi:acyl carrier protein
MTQEELRGVVFRLLGEIAPETDPKGLRPDLPIRDQLDLDSMDFLNFVIRLDKELHVAIPEKDYPKLASLEGCIDYLAARV